MSMRERGDAIRANVAFVVVGAQTNFPHAHAVDLVVVRADHVHAHRVGGRREVRACS
jgi:hypothetical protein